MVNFYTIYTDYTVQAKLTITKYTAFIERTYVISKTHFLGFVVKAALVEGGSPVAGTTKGD